ncbi:MAG: TrmB family transcriptional regulator [Alphaproteobacteria bacterium]|nr:TrmB family transcriptional regulator [Alphaproteobacteria bacterium]
MLVVYATTKMIVQAAQALENLGFSEIESLIYCFLLKESPATGYRISHAIGKPTANTYKAIAALAQRGAIVVDDAQNRLCRAVLPSELLDRLDRDFGTRRKQAETQLAKIRPATNDDRVYQLSDVEQVLERARTMLGQAKSIAIADAFPNILRQIAPNLEAAAKRGVTVAVRTYEPAKLKGVAVLLAGEAPRILRTWPGEQLNIVVDAEQYMLALLTKGAEAVHQAIWSNSTFLSCLQHNGLASELILTEAQHKGAAKLTALEKLSLTRSNSPGFQRLLQRYGDAPTPRRRRRAT